MIAAASNPSQRGLARLLPRVALALLIGFAAGGALAQAPGGAPAAPAAPAQAAPRPNGSAAADETAKARARLDAVRAELDQIEKSLTRSGLSDDDLSRLRQRLGPPGETVTAIIATLTPRADAVKARLDQLGAKPDEKAPPESPDVAREREDRQREYADISETLRLGRALLVQAEQINTTISDLRRGAFTRALFTRSASPLSPDLWVAVAQSLPHDAGALRITVGEWLSGAASRFGEGRIVALFAAVIAAIALYRVRARIAPRIVARERQIGEPTRLRRALGAAGQMLAGTLPAVAASLLVYAGLDGANLLPPRIQPVMVTLLTGLALVAFARSLADAMLAPGLPAWRLFSMPDLTAERLHRLVFVGSAVIVGGKVVEATLQAIGAGLQVSVLSKALFALIFALLTADTLRRIQSTEECAEESFGPYVPTEPSVAGPLRAVAWVVTALVVGGALVGYIAFASFLVDQVVWIASVGALLTLSIVLVDEAVAEVLAGKSRVSLALQGSIGLRKRSLEQIAVLTSGVLRLVLIIVAVMLVLAPWGVESVDLIASLRAAFFGFTVGGVTISLSTIVLAVIFFAVGILATRGIQRWLDTRFLPATDLDAGLRNSIKTGFGYLGIFVAVALALAQLGLSLDKIAIVAGALSVGIGFGLQSIVNNFVSGLILLWERSVRVGDWVEVGTEQGYVKRINVRSTEIETFDRASIIVPNSNFVSGIVKNWLHNDRMGRVHIKIGVSYESDPQQVAAILEDCARAHPSVLEKPAPAVLFTNFGDSALDFDLYCFVAEVETRGRVGSDLRFSIFRRLKEAGIEIPFPQRDMNLRGIDRLESALVRLAERPPAQILAREPAQEPAQEPAEERPARKARNGARRKDVKNAENA
ncbi:DUF3772 domain-containing protein [Chelatococcus sp. SYSU_G07232]|uniref:DUF3772 domain-containing protein n=1 Tax=Chelatococcus albus TaxID=3047466 RepID=A0ABT7ADG2_9HYPH|nr:DUF3772 domain-containing protein [Chelatococcus sp. SYSU_G07232]MDJ1157413.1 DUF3772 domain-containing protein [Chelatococcus sp. SYSU_G07232]